MSNSWKDYLKLFKRAWKIFTGGYPVEFASSFAYFSLFGLPAILLIVVLFLSMFFDISMLFEEVRSQLEVVVGSRSADAIVMITSNYLEQATEGIFLGIFYFVTIFLLATQLIIFFQDVLNNFWQIKPNFKSFWQKHLKERGLASLMVVLTGLLFFASSAIERGLDFLTGGGIGSGMEKVLVNFITGILVYLWFALLFKVLPFATIRWKPHLIGAAVTSFLFFLGFWVLLEFAIKEESLEKIYDFATPVVQVSFWIFYNALAFLFGASFTKAYAEMTGEEIEAKPYSYRYRLVKAAGTKSSENRE